MTSVPAVRAALLEWFRQSRRDLPWRRTQDPYAIWVSEVMLQQTQVTTVIPYWNAFLERFPTLPALAEAPLPDVLSAWRGLGYYSRARNLHRAAQTVVAHHQGKLPRDAEALLALPGFGRYTAGAVASIAFGLPEPLVDGNVARVLSRLFVVEGVPGDRERERKLWSLAEALVVGDEPGNLNQALMELGALICRPEPTCLLCPVREQCGALAAQRVHQLPPARQRAPRKKLALTVALLARRGKYLLARRAEKGLFGGLWELPNVEATSELADAGEQLGRALGLKLTLGAPLATIRRTLTHRDLVMNVFSAEARGSLKLKSPYTEGGWFALKQFAKLGMSTAMSHAVSAVTEKSNLF